MLGMMGMRRYSVLVILLAGCSANSARKSSAADTRVSAGLEQLRVATRPFQQLDAAVAAGYNGNVKDCLVHEHHGAMGYHHVNSNYVDAKVEVDKPEILLYERMPDGSYRLNGVEFIIPYRAWPRDSVAPILMGQQLKHEDNLKIWYLHVWAWSNNQDGVFADFNPNVQCSADTRKIFRPSSGG
jgi:hypothetical protein